MFFLYTSIIVDYVVVLVILDPVDNFILFYLFTYHAITRLRWDLNIN